MSLVVLSGTAEIGGVTQPLMLQISSRGLIAGHYGTLPWAGTEVEINVRSAGCFIRMRANRSGESVFFVPSSCLGGSNGVQRFAAWLEKGASSSGAIITRERAAA